MKTTEAELIDHAVQAMRREGVPVTPNRVERAVNAATNASRRVAEYLAPRDPGGSGSEVVANTRVGKKEAQQYADPVPHYAAHETATPASAETGGGPVAADELAALKAKRKKLQALADGATDLERLKLRGEIQKLDAQILALEPAVRPVPLAAQPPSAGRDAKLWATPSPHFQLNDATRAEYVAQVAGLKAQIAAPGLSPGARIRLEQDLKHFEDLLRLDGSTPTDHTPYQERVPMQQGG